MRNGLRKQSSRLVGPLFLAVKTFSQSGAVVAGESRDYCKLVWGGRGLSHERVENGW